MKPPYLNPGQGYVLLFKGRGFLSRLIRWQTRSQYSHAALLLPEIPGDPNNPFIIEAWQGAGVRQKTLTDWTDIDTFAVLGTTPGCWRNAAQFATQQRGCRYDYRGVFRFLTRSKPESDGKWFCSELVFASLQHAGIDLLEGVNAGAVSPAMLRLSPLLVQII